MALIIGPKHGHAKLSGTAGNDTILASGGYNTISGGGGDDSILAGTGGFALVTISTPGDGVSTASDTVGLFGAANMLVTGDENVSVFGHTGNSLLTLGNGRNHVDINGHGDTVTAGSGMDTVTALGGGAEIVFAGAGNSGLKTVVVSGLGNSVTSSFYSGRQPASGTVDISGGSGNGTFSLESGDGSVLTAGEHNSIFAGGGTIVAGSGFDSVNVAASLLPTDVVLAGFGNTVTGITGNTTITGGAGNSVINLSGQASDFHGSSGPVDIQAGGLHNNITLFADPFGYTVNAGSGEDTVSALISSSNIQFNGAGDQLLLQENVITTVNDASQGLLIDLETTGFGSLTIDNFDKGGLVDFNPQIGFTSVQQILDDITKTGADTYTLRVPGSAHDTIVFVDPAHLGAGSFKIG